MSSLGKYGDIIPISRVLACVQGASSLGIARLWGKLECGFRVSGLVAGFKTLFPECAVVGALLLTFSVCFDVITRRSD